MRVVHEKTREENWVPLFDDAGVPLYPELMGELDALKRERIGGLMLRRDWGERVALADRARRSRSHAAQGEAHHPRGGIARRTLVHVVPAWRLHRGGRRRFGRRRDQSTGAAQLGEGAAALRQTHDEASRRGCEETAGGANGRMMPKCLIAMNPWDYYNGLCLSKLPWDFRGNRGDLRKAFNASVSAFQLADQFYFYWREEGGGGGGEGGEGRERKKKRGGGGGRREGGAVWVRSVRRGETQAARSKSDQRMENPTRATGSP